MVLQYLSDAVKIQAEIFHSWFKARKVLVTPAFDKKVKLALDKAEPTEYLFGNNIKDLIHNVKLVERVAKDLSKKPTKPMNTINWKGSLTRMGVPKVNRGEKNYANYANSRSVGGKKPFNQRQFVQTQPFQRKPFKQQNHQPQQLQQ